MSQKVVIIGSGIFGMSTGLWMLETAKDKYDVTILEKSTVVPAPDAASTDINKIVRAGDYADPLLAELSVDAVEHWKKPEWEGCYHESGVMCLSGSDAGGRKFVDTSYENIKNMNLGPEKVDTHDEIRSKLPSDVEVGRFDNRSGYYNKVGGWGEAARSVEVGLKRIKSLGGKVRGGAEVVSFKKQGKKITGVVLQTGEVVPADLVVVAAGAWSPALMSSPAVAARFPPVVATGQVVAMVQLTPEEVKAQSKCPVIFNLDNGFYVFPPTADGIVKLAIHAGGYTNHVSESYNGSKVSLPRTKLSPDTELGVLPVEAVQALRAHLATHYPALARKPFADVRMCWYCDTVTGDWLIDYHPDYDNLFLATGGSGHAYKFACVIGREVLAILERRGNPVFTDRFSFAPSAPSGADVRNGPRMEIDLNKLAKPADLVPNGRQAARL